MNKRVLLIICDGLGLAPDGPCNAWSLAHTTTLDKLLKTCPFVPLKAAGKSVGLPANQIGNSEVGHLTIGGGRVVLSGLPLINKSISDKSFFKNHVLKKEFESAKKRNVRVHVVGLLSPGGVHSHENHFFAILKMAHEGGLTNVVVHAFADGRDVQPKSFLSSATKMVAVTKKYGYVWGSLSGRYYGMDRDKNFDRTSKAYYAINETNSAKQCSNIEQYVKKQYSLGKTDEFLQPMSFTGNPGLKKEDLVVMINFRPDRARQMAHIFVGSELYGVSSPGEKLRLHLVTMMQYPKIHSLVAFTEPPLKKTLGVVLTGLRKSQLRIAETEKYAHVTFFFDGGQEFKDKSIHRMIIPSLKTTSFAFVPQMSAEKITTYILKNIKSYDFIVCNFANPDMVGHTGELKPTIEALSFLDKQIKRLLEVSELTNTTVFLTGDHGNAEKMCDAEGKPLTKHTTNEVPFVCTDKNVMLKPGSLADVAPTILSYLSLTQPSEMTGKTLIIRSKKSCF